MYNHPLVFVCETSAYHNKRRSQMEIAFRDIKLSLAIKYPSLKPLAFIEPIPKVHLL